LLVPLLDHASLEDEPSLQEMWTSLLVNAVNPEKEVNNKVFVFLLSQISKSEALLLKKLESEGKQVVQDLVAMLDTNVVEVVNLNRLGLIEIALLDWFSNAEIIVESPLLDDNSQVESGKEESRSYFHGDNHIMISPLGKALLKACER
jgi:hypothetical protein